MSDTPSEIRDHRGAIYNARGHVLIFGLGIGMVAKAILDKPEVTKVTVVDLSPDVIKLVGPTLLAKYGDKLEIIEADALTWKPPKGVRYGAVWADIWDEISEDNLKEMSTFNRRYGRLSDWHGNWGESIAKAQRARNKRPLYGWAA
jgi:predicted membrane-bound spermidine synthase